MASKPFDTYLLSAPSQYALVNNHDPNNDEDEEQLKQQSLDYEKLIYAGGVFSSALFATWISWMPFLNVLLPGMSEENKLTTISHTFKQFNPLVMVYLSGPLTIFFLFRVYRTFINHKISSMHKKIIFLDLLLSQYSLFVVLQYEAIPGTIHYVFTFITIATLYLYHLIVVDETAHSHNNLKKTVGVLGFGALVTFAIILQNDDTDLETTLWTVACVAEVVGICFLGLLDVIDIYVFGRNFDDKDTNYRHQKKS